LLGTRRLKLTALFLSGGRLYARWTKFPWAEGGDSAVPNGPSSCEYRGVVYESYDQPALSRRMFARRVVLHGLAALALLLIPLLVGIVGYMALADMSPVDAFLNASMILGGMGPVDPMPTDAAKLFAGFYALFAGVFFLVIAGVILAPFLHRVLHLLHISADGGGDSD
jgi:hypothetical protein